MTAPSLQTDPGQGGLSMAEHRERQSARPFTAGMVAGFAINHWATVAAHDVSRLWLVPLLMTIVAAIVWWRRALDSDLASSAVRCAIGGWLAAILFGATFTLDPPRVSQNAWLGLDNAPALLMILTLAAILVIATGVIRLAAGTLPVTRRTAPSSWAIRAALWGGLVGSMLLATDWAIATLVLSQVTWVITTGTVPSLFSIGVTFLCFGSLWILGLLLYRPLILWRCLAAYLGFECTTGFGVATWAPLPTSPLC